MSKEGSLSAGQDESWKANTTVAPLTTEGLCPGTRSFLVLIHSSEARLLATLPDAV